MKKLFYLIKYLFHNIKYKKIICPIENIPDKYLTSNGDVLSKLKTVYFKNDLLRCLVIDIDNENLICKVSLKWIDDSIEREDNGRIKLVKIFFINYYFTSSFL
jgi:hypothetical protein